MKIKNNKYYIIEKSNKIDNIRIIGIYNTLKHLNGVCSILDKRGVAYAVLMEVEK